MTRGAARAAMTAGDHVWVREPLVFPRGGSLGVIPVVGVGKGLCPKNGGVEMQRVNVSKRGEQKCGYRWVGGKRARPPSRATAATVFCETRSAHMIAEPTQKGVVPGA